MGKTYVRERREDKERRLPSRTTLGVGEVGGLEALEWDSRLENVVINTRKNVWQGQ